MKKSETIKEQLRRNTVALISVAIAIMSLSYNTWRDGASEHNRNQRTGSYEVLLQLGELQQLVFHLHYDRDESRGNPRTGWAIVLTIRDIALILDEPVPAQAEALLETWDEHWQGLGEDPDSVEAIVAAINATRMASQTVIRNLD